MKLGDLTPNPKNPRTISESKLEMLKKSLNEFGDLSGIVFNRTTKHLVGGHQRTKVFNDSTEIVFTKKYKNPTRTGTVAEGHIMIDGERFSYREVKWPVKKEKAANIAANKGAGEWDMAQLGSWMRDLEEDAVFDVDLTMFDASEREQFQTKPDKKGLIEDDEIPEETPPVCKHGQIWQLGDHRLMCGDSTDKTMVEKLMNGEKANMVFTDPPYGIDFKSNMKFTDGTRNTRKRVKGDEAVNPKLIRFISEITDGPIFVCSRWDVMFGFIEELKSQNLKIKNVCVWVKNGVGMGDLKGQFLPNWEAILFAHKGDFAFPNGRPNDVWQIGQLYTQGHRHHSTEKTPRLAEHAIACCLTAGQTVADLFGGSGSTLIACEKTNRKCFMMELDPHYCDVIISRWEKYTGKKAVLISKDETKNANVKRRKQA